MMLDLKIINPIPWKLVFFARRLLEATEIFSCTEGTHYSVVKSADEQIEVDEAKEKNFSLSSSKKGLRKEDRKQLPSPTKALNYPFRTGTVAAA